MLRRYPLQPVMGIVILLAIFTAISFGIAKYPMLDLFEGGDKRIVVATFFCWVVAMGAIGQIGGELEEDIKLGLLEPVFLSRHSVSQVILVRSLSSSVSGLLFSFCTLWVLATYVGAHLQLGPVALLALIVLDLSLSGIGLFMAGLVIQLKRAASVVPLFYLGFGILIAKQISLKSDDAMFHFPITSAVELFSRIIFGSAVSPAQIVATLLWTAFSVAIGIVSLRWCSARARHSGSLAHY